MTGLDDVPQRDDSIQQSGEPQTPGPGLPSDDPGMPIWKRFWILFTAIWLLMALLSAATMIAFAENIEADRMIKLLAGAVLVPAALYAAGSLQYRFRKRRR
jgi:hypothetical protein